MRVDTNSGVVNNPEAGVWEDSNYHAMKYQPIVDGWYVGCVITLYLQVDGRYRRGPTFTPSHHPAYCTQSGQTWTSNEPYAS